MTRSRLRRRPTFVLLALLLPHAVALQPGQDSLRNLAGPVTGLTYTSTEQMRGESEITTYKGQVKFNALKNPILIEEARTGGPYASPKALDQDVFEYDGTGGCLRTFKRWDIIDIAQSDNKALISADTYAADPCVSYGAEFSAPDRLQAVMSAESQAGVIQTTWMVGDKTRVSETAQCSRSALACTLTVTRGDGGPDFEKDVSVARFTAGRQLAQLNTVWTLGEYTTKSEFRYDGRGWLTLERYDFSAPRSAASSTVSTYTYAGLDAQGNWTRRTEEMDDTHTRYHFTKTVERQLQYGGQ